MEGRRQRTHSSPGGSNKASVLLRDRYRLVVMGAAKVGKTCLVSRMLHQELSKKYKATVEEFHQGEYEINGRPLTLDILDTAGAYEFPAMRDLSIATGDAFILVYSIGDEESFERIRELRKLILEKKAASADIDSQEAGQTPIVIVGNKADLEPADRSPMQKTTMETTVAIDWGHGYVEASAKENTNISQVFRELMVQAKVALDADSVVSRRGSLPEQSSTPQRPKYSKRNSVNCVIS